MTTVTYADVTPGYIIFGYNALYLCINVFHGDNNIVKIGWICFGQSMTNGNNIFESVSYRNNGSANITPIFNVIAPNGKLCQKQKSS